ncbi:6-phosphogluconate dehydratase, partial [Pseudomonas donghuensis]|nr:6-phosphogluconate dehydratase [Pseudomonas donghuensis]
EGKSFDEICKAGQDYLASTHLLFILRSIHNLAQNGRVSKLAAGAVGILGIQILAKASEQGTIEPVEKCRGDKKARN